jgi:hypothetical protein
MHVAGAPTADGSPAALPSGGDSAAAAAAAAAAGLLLDSLVAGLARRRGVAKTLPARAEPAPAAAAMEAAEPSRPRDASGRRRTLLPNDFRLPPANELKQRLREQRAARLARSLSVSSSP